MEKEKGVIIAAYKPSKKPRFIALKRNKNWEGWELPKGHLENQDYEKTVKIELKEETGIEENQIKSIRDLNQTLEWSFEKDGEKVQKEYRGFIVKLSKDSHVDISQNPHDEHEAGFFFRFRDVDKMLTYEGQSNFLKQAKQSIKED